MKHTFLLAALGLAMSLDPLAAAPQKEHHLGPTGLIGMNQLPFAESALIAAVSGAFLSVQKPAEISGAPYDWKKTKQPERPYMHAYHQTLVMKIFLASKQPDGGCDVELDFEQALAVIKRLDNITLGMPKIVYLVGWQHNGHDAKYPDWSVVNPRLKRQQDATALDSLKWLMSEGFNHHTTVSLHLNMFDAYADSPLWETYLKNDIIAKDRNGVLIKGELHGAGTGPDSQSYYISYARDWDTGFAKSRTTTLTVSSGRILKTTPENQRTPK